MRQHRRLAAIMFTDMVGYSALVQENEDFALELLEEHRQFLRPYFPKYDGREVETIGDAFFVEFTSALEAVLCAIDIQKALWERNKGLPPRNHIKIRIGIHLGDVVPKGENVLGDGVNIAARIEPLAQSCGICISEDVARQVQNKIDFPLKKVENEKLKNIKVPVKVYAVVLDWLEEIPDSHPSRKRNKLIVFLAIIVSVILLIFIGFNLPNWKKSTEPIQTENPEWHNSIAVLPFVDLSPQKDQEYFCDGMTEQILTNLAQLNSLKVIARTSVMKFKNTQKTIPEIGAELNVKNILEGSIRKFDDRIRVTVQLVRSVDGSHIWAEDYDREYKELFAIQDEISKAIADTLSEKISMDEINTIKTERTVNLEAYEFYLKAEYLHRNRYWSTYSIEDFRDSEQMFLQAIELDPGYAPAYAGLVDLYNTCYNTQDLSIKEKQRYLDLQEKYIGIAYELDPESADVNRVMGWVYGAKNEIANKFKFIKKAAGLDANDPENIRALGISYDNIGLKKLALKNYNRCINLDPYDAKYYFYDANIHLNLGQYKKAKSGFQKALKLEPNDPKFLMRYTWLLFQMKEFDEAEILCSKYNQFYPNTGENRFLKALLFAKNNEKEKAIAMDLSPENMRLLYLFLKMSEEAISSTETYVEQNKKSERSYYLILKNQPLYDFLRSDTRFQKMLAIQKELYEENLSKYGDTD